MPAVSKLDYLHPQDNGPQIIFDALPIETAKSFVVLLIVFSTCLGAVLIELVNHISFDIALIKKPGWSHPTKLLSRSAYLFCRFLSPACLLLVVVLLVAPLDDCDAVPKAFNALGMVLIDSVALIFVQRTMALYSWKSNVAFPLTFAYSLLVISTAFCIPFYGVGYRIPGTRFCAYDPHRDHPRTLAANITFKSITMCLDLTLLVLTLHRLIDGGLRSLWLRTPRQFYVSLTSTSFASFLVRQGFHFYIVQTCTEITFISIYYGANQLPYQVIGSALVFSVPPLAAAAAFRDMSVHATSIKTRDDSAGKENAYGLQNVSEDQTVAYQSDGNKHTGTVRLPVTTDSSILFNGFDSVQLQTGQRSNGSAATDSGPDSSKMAWRARTSLSVTDHDRKNDTQRSDASLLNGVLITVGTQSRSEFVRENSRQTFVNESSVIDNDAAENLAVIELQRYWPRLSSRCSLVQMRGSHYETTPGSPAASGQDDAKFEAYNVHTGENWKDIDSLQSTSPLPAHRSVDTTVRNSEDTARG